MMEKTLTTTPCAENDLNFKNLAKAAPVGIFLTDAAGDCVYVNDKLLEIGGLSYEAALGRGWLVSVHPDDRDRVIAELQTSAANKRPLKSECRFLNARGVTTWVLAQAQPMTDADGAITGYAGTITDITERKNVAEALRQIGLALTATRDADQVLKLVVEESRRLTGALFAYVVVPDKPYYRIVAVAGEDRGYRDSLKLSDDPLSPFGRGPLGKAVRELRTVVCEDVSADPDFIAWREIASERGIRSLVAVPIMVQGNPYGALITYSARPKAYDYETIALLTSLMAQAAAALENARLLQETERRAKEQAALSAIATATNQSLDLDQVLRVSLQKLKEITGREMAYIRLIDPLTNRLRVSAHEGLSEEALNRLNNPRIGGIGEKVLATGEPVVMNDSQDTLLRDLTRSQERVSVAWFPLKVHAETVGILNVATARLMPFSDGEVRLLQAIADVIGVAIGNAKLYEETVRRAREQEALSSVAMATNQFLDIKAVIGIALDKVVEISGRERAYIRLQNAATGNMELIAHRGLTAAHVELIMKGRFDGKSARVFATGEPLFTNDQDRPRRKMDTGSARNAVSARIPLKARGKTIGILNVGSSQPMPFLTGEVRLLQALANVIGVGIENAGLFAAAQRNLARVRALHEIDSAILSAAGHESVLRVLLEKIDLFVHYSSATIRMWNPETEALEPVVCQKLDEQMWKKAAPGAGWGPAKATFDAKATLTIRDCRSDPRVYGPEFFQNNQLVSYLGVPLIAQNKVLGVMSFYTNEEHEFTSEEIEFVETLAGQAAVALDRSLLYRDLIKREAQLQLSHKQLEALHSVTVQAGQSLDLDTVTQGVIDKITEIFDFDATRFYLYNEKMDELRVKGQFEKNPGLFSGVKSFARGQGNVGKVAESGEPIIFEDVSTDPVYRKTSSTQTSRKSGYKFYAALPIRGSRQILGTMVCMGVAPRRLNDGELQLLTAMVGRVAVAVENASLYEEIRKRAAELQQKTWELETANRVKGEFLSVMSHELRTPLSVIMGYAGMLKEGMLGEMNGQQHAAVQKMLFRAGDQLNIINDIMQTTQIESSSIVAERQEIDASRLLRDLAAVYGEGIDGKDVSIHWNYPPAVLPVVTDGAKLRQILQNLIANAGKFTETGTITVSARRAEEWVEFVVADTGIGIPLDMQTMIFEKFKQVDSSETRSYGGVGLGLYIAKQFTEMLGGRIEVESQVGKGTQFTLRLPAPHALSCSDHAEAPDGSHAADIVGAAAGDKAGKIDGLSEIPPIGPNAASIRQRVA